MNGTEALKPWPCSRFLLALLNLVETELFCILQPVGGGRQSNLQSKPARDTAAKIAQHFQHLGKLDWHHDAIWRHILLINLLADPINVSPRNETL